MKHRATGEPATTGIPDHRKWVCITRQACSRMHRTQLSAFIENEVSFV